MTPADLKSTLDLELELDSLNDRIDDFVRKNSSLVDSCRELIARVNRHKLDTNIAKSVATGVSGVAGVTIIVGIGLALAPITAGVSALVSIGLGIGGGVTAAAAGVTGIGAEVGDYFQSKSFRKRVSSLARERNSSVNRLNRKLTHFDTLLRDLSDHNRATSATDDGHDIHKCVTLGCRAVSSAFNVGKHVITSIDAVRDIRAFNVANAVMKTAVPTTGKLVANGGLVALGLALIVVDAVYLVRDWNTAHPTVGDINELIACLQTDHKNIQSIHTKIKAEIKSHINRQNYLKMNPKMCTQSGLCNIL